MRERKRKRRENYDWEDNTKLVYKIVGAVFAGLVLLLTVISIIKPDVKYSEEEKRVLAKAPEFTVAGIKDKEYMAEAEAYTSDQFLMRDTWIRLKVHCDLLLGKREFNGVYLGKDRYLIQNLSTPDEKNVEENLSGINGFAERNQNVSVYTMIVPNAAYVMQEYLPKGAPVRDQEKDAKMIQKQLSDKVKYVDVSGSLQKHVDEGMYYKTDHHWTSKAAAYAFYAAAPQIGIKNPVSDYDIYTVTTKFSGTLAAKSGYHKEKDAIEIYVPKNEKVQYLVSDSDDKEKRPTLYDKEALKGKDQYQVFMGGNHAKVEIATANNTEKKLLMFKDSYANSFIPFLLPYYNEIIVIDPRYYYDEVQTVMASKGITDVLFLYNMDTFLTDNSIADVLAVE